MANVNQLFLNELSQSIGISYDMKSNALGSPTNPNSAIFNINQIYSLLVNGAPIFGVNGVQGSFATMSFVNTGTQYQFQFSPGQVFYQKNIILVPSQVIPAQNSTDQAGIKLFQFYLDYNDFQLASTVFTFTITSVNGNTITVNQLPEISYLNNFQTVTINNYQFGVVSINPNKNTIVLNQNVILLCVAGVV